MTRPDDISKLIYLIRFKITSDLIATYNATINICNEAKLSPNYEDSTSAQEKQNIEDILEDAIEDIAKFSNFIW